MRFFSRQRQFAARIHKTVGKMPREMFLYKLAFRHSSLVSSRKYSAKECNERLEFLGDAVLDTVVSEYLFKRYPLKGEGFLTDMRSKIVNRRSLNELGQLLGLSEFIQYVPSRRGHSNRSMHGDALEALIGAIYLDHGFKRARKFINKRILRKYVNLKSLEETIYNFKSMLLEHVQREKMPQLIYELLEEQGEGNDKIFKVQVKIGKEPMGIGLGKRKKLAEQKASQNALIKLNVLEKMQNEDHSSSSH